MIRSNKRTILSLTALAITGGILSAGPLDPPAGPVTSTYKTLNDVEPRIAMNTANTPGNAGCLFRITQPGSYYLTGNVAGVIGKHGIEVTASGVTIDLMGFELAGVPGMGAFDGIRSNAINIHNIKVINGSVRGWGGAGVHFINTGMFACHIEGVQASDNISSGIGISASYSTVTNCTGTGNGGSGISVGTGARVTSCIADNNTLGGIYASQGSTVSGCSTQGNSAVGITLGFGCTVSGCSSADNTGDGINASNGTTITNCSAFSNTGNGIFAYVGITIQNCTVYGNTLSGIDTSATCIVEGCTARSNVLDGIQCGSSCLIRNNACTGNAAGTEIGAGIHATGSNTRIEGNNCTSNDFGIDIDAAGNIIVRNSCADNTQNFVIGVNNIFGTIVDRTAPGTGAVVGNAAAGTMGSTDPNANFAY